jgi:quinol monooxygenase YgiN
MYSARPLGKESSMSVLVIIKYQGDVGHFRTTLTERAGEYVQVAERAKAAGCLHHRYGVIDERNGFTVEEWESAEACQAFYATPEMQQFIASVGAEPNTQPEVTVGEAISSPDEF